MKNLQVQTAMDTCKGELDSVVLLCNTLGGGTHIASLYLTRYALIRACGAVETAYKAIVADFCARGAIQPVSRFIDLKVRLSSSNPSYANICKLLSSFDERWARSFRTAINARADKDKLLTGLESLVESRNDFAHGGTPTITLSDVVTYFGSARTLIEALDASIQ